ncbi:MAG: DoxX family protein [Planctomycetota bacterium]|nr:DoxX family protein [Planctomycetota bacterium]
MLNLSVIAQIVIAAAVLYVWIFRFENIEKEFEEYRLSVLFRSFIGATKIALATLLIVGIWFQAPVLVAAISMAVLMAGAQWSHFKVRHAFPKFVPSLILLVLSLFVAAVHSGVVS